MSLIFYPGWNKMTHFSQSIAQFTTFPSLRWLPVFAALAAVTVPATADAATRVRGGGAYDGTWNVVFATTRGNCSSGYKVPFQVAGNRVSSAGGGRLAGTSGAGSWRGIISGDQCSGTWQATRG